jgi:PAS domain S-box-containing protein
MTPAGETARGEHVMTREPDAPERTDEQVRISEERYRLLAESVNDVIWTMSMDGRITYVSPSVERMRGFTPAEAMAQPLEQIHPPASAAVSAAYFVDLAAKLRAGETPEPFRGELEYYRKDGSTIWTEAQVIPRFGPDGQVRDILGVTRDISARKRAETEVLRLNDELEERVRVRTAQLEAANRELEGFVYSAAHDLRAPLRAIDGFSQLVADDAAGSLPQEDLEHLQRVRTAAQRMGQLIDRLLVLARTAAKAAQPEEVDVSALAVSVLDDLRLLDRERRVDIRVQPGLTAHADPLLLNVVLTALLDNAWKFTVLRGLALVEIGALARDGGPTFYVRDNGAGFAPAEAERIFAAFQRASTAVEYPGDGLGLATVRRLVAMHGGRVWAEGEVDKGATFFFTLPPAV